MAYLVACGPVNKLVYNTMPKSEIRTLRRQLNDLRRKHEGDISIDSRVKAIRRNLALLERGEGGPGLPQKCTENIADLAEFMKTRT